MILNKENIFAVLAFNKNREGLKWFFQKNKDSMTIHQTTQKRINSVILQDDNNEIVCDTTLLNSGKILEKLNKDLYLNI